MTEPRADASASVRAPTTREELERAGAAIVARAEGLTKIYGHREAAVSALDDVTIGIPRGRMTAIMGPSGSGKSTLVHCMAGLESPTSGRVSIGSRELNDLDDNELTRLRRDRVGFVFQAFNLVPTLTAFENIVLPLALAGTEADQQWLDTIIDTIGLRYRLAHRPSELSGGEQQRVACARALITNAEIVFADEPTGNLDSQAGSDVMSLLRASVDDSGQSVVIVTHDPSIAGYADLVVFLADGRIVDQMVAPSTERVLERLKRGDLRPRRPGGDTDASPHQR